MDHGLSNKHAIGNLSKKTKVRLYKSTNKTEYFSHGTHVHLKEEWAMVLINKYFWLRKTLIHTL